MESELMSLELDQLAAAVVKVIEACKRGLAKNMDVGTGNSAYKGISDADVKIVVGTALTENGLCLLPVEVKPKLRIERWQETYNGNSKMKAQVFTEVRTKYLLLHSSGQRIILEGYGHGTDTQDKSAGKATTYAEKYLLLYLGLVPTLNIDDTDNTHSEDLGNAPLNQKAKKGRSAANQPPQQTPEPPKTPTPPQPITEEKLLGYLDSSLENMKKALKVVTEGFKWTATEEQKQRLAKKIAELESQQAQQKTAEQPQPEPENAGQNEQQTEKPNGPEPQPESQPEPEKTNAFPEQAPAESKTPEWLTAGAAKKVITQDAAYIKKVLDKIDSGELKARAPEKKLIKDKYDELTTAQS